VALGVLLLASPKHAKTAGGLTEPCAAAKAPRAPDPAIPRGARACFGRKVAVMHAVSVKSVCGLIWQHLYARNRVNLNPAPISIDNVCSRNTDSVAECRRCNSGSVVAACSLTSTFGWRVLTDSFEYKRTTSAD